MEDRIHIPAGAIYSQEELFTPIIPTGVDVITLNEMNLCLGAVMWII
jgi:hypothetical protein